MEDIKEFNLKLQAAINEKQNWFNTVALPETLGQYRLLSSCAKNLYDMLKKKSLVTPDPYAVDKRISEIIVPETSNFPDSDIPSQLGARFADYEAMLDFVSNYMRFSVDNLPTPTIKKMLDLNSVFDWTNLSINNSRSNTHALATQFSAAKLNAPAILVSMINDCTTKSTEAVVKINKTLNELGIFQKELYKAELRRDLFEHPEFSKEKAFSSPDAELAEIKRLYSKVIGKKTFYTDLINEIILEDQGPDKEKLREAVLKKLVITATAVGNTSQKKRGPDTKAILMDTVMAVGGLSPTLLQLQAKLQENFGVFFSNKISLWKRFVNLFKKAFKIAPKERVITIKVVESKTGGTREQKVKVNELMEDVSQKVRVYNGIANQGAEFNKLMQYPEDKIYNFVAKQISECQALFTIINGLDSFFKTEVDIINRPKIKGVQIELSAMRNSIIAANKKRGEYQSLKEENDQMNKLGL